jgi:hypothetical protein
MCRLFGITAGAEPMKATFWLLDAPDSLEAQKTLTGLILEPDG